MRTFLPIFVATLSVVLGCSAQNQDPNSPEPVAKEIEVPEDSSTKETGMTALSYDMTTLDGETVALSKYKGNVVLIVNVASECGLTPQYEQLQALHEKYAGRGLAVIGFPCNQFGGQEPGTAEEIRQFCSRNYGVEFDMFAKVDVNGENACGLYNYLTQLDTQPKGPGEISWNFEKFLIGRDGNVIARYSPQTKPDALEIIEAVEKALAAPAG